MCLKSRTHRPFRLTARLIENNASRKHGIHIQICIRLNPYDRQSGKYHINQRAGLLRLFPCKKRNLLSFCDHGLLVKGCIIQKRKDPDRATEIRKCSCFPCIALHIGRQIPDICLPVACQFFSAEAQSQLLCIQSPRKACKQLLCLTHFSCKRTGGKNLPCLLLPGNPCKTKDETCKQQNAEQQYRFFTHSISPVCPPIVFYCVSL